MGPRLIFRGRPLQGGETNQVAFRDGRGTVVIADYGAEAEVLVFPPEQPVGCGVEFDYRGMTWVIVATHRDSGVLVAEPACH